MDGTGRAMRGSWAFLRAVPTVQKKPSVQLQGVGTVPTAPCLGLVTCYYRVALPGRLLGLLSPSSLCVSQDRDWAACPWLPVSRLAGTEEPPRGACGRVVVCHLDAWDGSKSYLVAFVLRHSHGPPCTLTLSLRGKCLASYPASTLCSTSCAASAAQRGEGRPATHGRAGPRKETGVRFILAPS